VISSLKDSVDPIASPGTLPSGSEEQTQNLFVSDLQTQTGESETVAPPGNSSSTNSQTPLRVKGHRKIIMTPARNCGSSEKKDAFGICRPIW
jgi:hypothetical protein